ncbi:hypothetical protein ACFU6I_45190 [Streptomyces sp. NPDC057486]|uniref:hypothetical protein n=1 Tax=Streptomyces sp. NPDC057486 TaxID=3346145 RepID=UPI00369DCE89
MDKDPGTARQHVIVVDGVHREVVDTLMPSRRTAVEKRVTLPWRRSVRVPRRIAIG